jgi:hypothetical protein
MSLRMRSSSRSLPAFMLLVLLGVPITGCMRPTPRVSPRNPLVLPVQPQKAASPEVAKKEFEGFDIETKNVKVGQLDISMPVFHHPNPVVAAALAATFNPDVPVEDNRCGSRDVSVVSANTGLLSVVARTSEYACVDPEAEALAAQGMGGAPGGAQVLGTVFVIDGDDVVPVSFGEIVASPAKAASALKRYCEKEVAAPDEVVKRHDGECGYDCAGVDEIGQGEWSFGVDAEALHLYRSGSSCDLIVPYADIAPWLETDSPLLRILRAPDVPEE